jgi:hypothetical protein
MTFFVGHSGAIKLQRGGENTFAATVQPADINTSLNRFAFDGSENNLITGDLIELSTTDPRGIIFISGATEDFRAYANINAVGGVRLFENFSDAINNERANETALIAFSGEPILMDVGIRDTRYGTLGSVVSFEINTDRAAIDTTSLSDTFRQQYSAGLLSGNGSIECLFSYETVEPRETPLFLLQVINRLDVGSTFKALLSLSSIQKTSSFLEEVYYDIEAVVTRAGVTVTSDALVSCSIDFVTTGDFKLRVGTPPEYILKEDDDAIYIEQSLDYLLQEATD